MAKEALVLYESTISELNIPIKIATETAKSLSFFADNVEFWGVSWCETVFFKLFKSSDDNIEIKFFYKQHWGLQPWGELFTCCQGHENNQQKFQN